MNETIFLIVVFVVIGINVATTVSPRFRRWLYSKEKR
jgi:hypothetical protein